jgi:DNA-binding transcriptional MerR regulator
MPGHTIGQLARSAGVPTSTVRYYERRGLLRPDARRRGDYRHYGQPALDRLRFIRTAQATGFSLKDVEELLGLTTADELPCDDITSVTKKRLAEVRARIRQLRHVEAALAKALRSCCKGEDVDLCREVARLQGREPQRPTGDYGSPGCTTGACCGDRRQIRA